MTALLYFLHTIVIYPLTQVIECLFVFSHKLFKDTGFSVLCLSGAVSVLCLPLYAAAEGQREIEGRTWKRLKPKIDRIKAVFKGDERYMILATYYRQNRYHPVYALRASFGLLVQIPFFIAAYQFLGHLEILRGAGFYRIPDLGAPDGLLRIGGMTVNILPLIMTFFNIASGVMYTKGLEPKDKAQTFGMAALFLALLYNAPSGLALYWTGNNVFSFLKNIYYKIPYTGKRRVVAALFSLLCVGVAAFCAIRFSHNPKAVPLVFLFLVSAVAPWISALGAKRGAIGFFLFNAVNTVVSLGHGLDDKRQTTNDKRILYGLTDLVKPSSRKFRAFSEDISSCYKAGGTGPLFLLAVLTVWALLGVNIPSHLIAASPQEFSFIDQYPNPLFFMGTAALQGFGLLVFWPVCLYLLFSRAVKKGLSLFFLSLALMTPLNAFLFPGNYGMISVDLVFDHNIHHGATDILANLAALLLTFGAALFLFFLFFLFFLYRKIHKTVPLLLLSCGLFSLLAVSGVNMVKIQREFSQLQGYYGKEARRLVEPEPICSLSRTGTNLVVIMLDRAISVFMPYIFEESPELREQYAGFTFYPNTVSFNGYTVLGAPPVFGGYEYAPLEMNRRDSVLLMEKHNQALLVMPRILSENGFSVCVTDPPYANYNWKSDLSIYDGYKGVKAAITDGAYTDYWMAEHNFNLPALSDGLKRNIIRYGIFKGLPLILRGMFYMDSAWVSLANYRSLRSTLNGYAVLAYLPRLAPITDDPLNTALIMTNNTTHEWSFTRAPEYRPAITVTNYGPGPFRKEMAYHVNAAAIKRLGEWFDLLKKERVYDNTRIIVVSDHGPEPNFVTKIGLPLNVDQFNPLLMVKDFNASGAMKTDTSFMSNADTPSLALRGIVDTPVNPFTGNPITMDDKKAPLYIAISGSLHILDKQATQFILDPKKDYYVHSNLFDPANWRQASSSRP